MVTLRPPPGRGPRPAAAGPIEAAGPPRRAGSVDGRGPVVPRGRRLPLCKYKPDYLPARKRSGRALSHHVLSQPAPTGGRADGGGTRGASRGKRGGPMTGGTLRQWGGGAGRGGHLTGSAPERRHDHGADPGAGAHPGPAGLPGHQRWGRAGVVFGEHSLLVTVSGQKLFVVKRQNHVQEPVAV
ncbi:ragulator complex protein LAMTOR4 isoform X1 [Harpia harpyja]|uniref:ragulator complex protein LAMTOR4 isoform X1 n=1 Tax=Harpia harpyja TaxID=202280 RepID=UPI0022B1E462|nr:ragulator complex protein LAMTOR4 isoform X1 [Harpia harpyja]